VTRFLVGVDLAAPGHDWLVDRAAAYATQAGGTVDLLFAGPQDPRLEALMQRVPVANRGVARCVAGSPEDVLVAATAGADALVVGPREPGALERMLKGTMATRVIKGAQCAVIVARGPRRDRPPRLLVGLDLRGQAGGMLATAAAWAVRLGGTVDGLYVDPTELPDAGAPEARTKLRKQLDAAREPIRRALAEVLATVPDAVRGEVRIEEGSPEAAIVDLSHEYDLVVVGTLGRPGVLGALRGSIADHVVRNAACDVLTVPATAASS
jgi:nucleotide-binding universal stress UspA family protein